MFKISDIGILQFVHAYKYTSNFKLEGVNTFEFIGNELLRKQNPSMLQKYRCSQLVQIESQR